MFPSLDYFCICICKHATFHLTSTFAYLSNNFVLIATTNQQLNNLLLPTCSLFQSICRLFCVPFINSLKQPYCLNYSTFATTYLRNFATNFTFFCNFLSTSNQFNSFFSNQPVNQTILFQLSNFIFLFFIDPPWICFWSDLPFLCQVFRGSHVEDRLTLVLDNSITCELYVMSKVMYQLLVKYTVYLWVSLHSYKSQGIYTTTDFSRENSQMIDFYPVWINSNSWSNDKKIKSYTILSFIFFILQHTKA